MGKFLQDAGFVRVAFILILAFGLNYAPARAADDTGSAGERGQTVSRQTVRSPANRGGPEDWPEHEGLSTSTLPDANRQMATPPVFDQSAQIPAPEIPREDVSTLPDAGDVTEPAPIPIAPVPAPIAPAPAPPARVEAPVSPPPAGPSVTGVPSRDNAGLPPPPQPPVAEPERETIYVDERGNPVPKPLEPENMLAEAASFMEQGKYDDALPILEAVRQIPGLSPALLERALYGVSDCYWARYADDPLAGYEPIVSSTNEALNANIRSPRVPDALLRLGLANINVGNLQDASGYVVALMRRFPDYPGVAQGFTALGAAQLKNDKNADAERSFAVVLDRYPESSQLEDASTGLARALVKQGKDERAQVILDFISKRWPRYYINDPDFLLMQAANDEKMNRPDAALNLDWLYVNLDPTRKENAPLLLKMADSYARGGDFEAAEFIYNNIGENFPDSPAAVTSRMRVAEKGIYDSPINYEDLSRTFSKNANPTLWQVYNELAADSGSSPEGVLSRLKQAMWLYWDKQYPEAMGKAAEFIDNYPEHKDLPQAREVLWRAFQKELEQSLAEHNYGRILLLWNGFPYVRERYGEMDAPLRYALSQGWLERGDEEKSFELLADFLKDPMDPNYGEAAFSQFFNHYLKNGSWDKILDLGNLVKNWRMKPELANQLEYAEALSAQNLNLGAAALNRWKRLANRTDIPLYQRAYATYFLARDAENRRDIRAAYEGNRKVVEMFTQLANERSDKADPERVKESIIALMDICEVGNRVPEALEWVARYDAYVPDDSPEYPGLRFREARLYRKLGDSARAQAILEDIAKRFPDSPFGQAAVAEMRTFEVSRDLSRFMDQSPPKEETSGTGSSSGNWSSSGQ